MVPVTDPMAAPAYADTRFQRFIEGLLYDPRDAVFVRLTLKVMLVMLPLVAAVYAWFSWPLALVLWAVQLGWLAPPVILMLHNTMHRPFFKRRPFLTRAHPYLMSGLFGIPTGYMEHHVAMHHVENNLPPDLSSTMRYQRDSFLHFLVYFARFFFLCVFELPSYLSRKKRGSLAQRALVSTLVHWAVMGALLFVNWRATVVVFVAPWFTIHLMMMIGNWGQHAFIDERRPGDSYVNSITCINSGYNARAFNDGYHIGHHVKMNRHWTQMPKDFVDNAERYAKEGCIVFERVDFFIVSMLLFAKRYDFLAKRFVRLPGDTRSHEEIVALLKARVRPIAAAEEGIAAAA
ncbi:MAG: fatty acid desaturase [Archangiaceae bacterium]|nr:fatty acid desaturase [Archangiaceae bacterium]